MDETKIHEHIEKLLRLQRIVGGPLEPRYNPVHHDDKTVTRNRQWLVAKAHQAERFFAHVRCGLHSNIPLCCIAWFVFVFEKRAFGMFGDLYREWPAKRHCGYIACPKCVLTRNYHQPLFCGCQRYKRPFPPLSWRYLDGD